MQSTPSFSELLPVPFFQSYKIASKKIGEGTFSEVVKAQSLKSGNYVAVKCMKTTFTSQEQVNKLREIQALKKLSPHPNIIRLHETIYDEQSGRLALVFDLMEMNMYELIKDRKTHLAQGKVKHFMYQLFKAIDHMHKKGIFHRDIKPENVLLLGDSIKLADLGSCRGTYSAHPYTEYISTRWYRSPECLMTDGYYDHKMDIWGAGCVMFEVLTLDPLFPGSNELDMIHRIHNILGTPAQRVLDKFKRHATHIDFNFPERAGSGFEKSLSHVSRDCIDLLKLLLTYDPEERITAEQALKHDYFRELMEADRQKDFQNSLTSVRLSPRVKNFNQTYVPLGSEKFTQNMYDDHDKTIQLPQNLKKAQAKKQKKDSNDLQPKLPFLNQTLKVEGLLKPSMNHIDTSTDDDSKRGLTLPPLKPHLFPPIENRGFLAGSSGFAKKKEDYKKFSNTLLRPALSNQLLFKKSKKSTMVFRSPDYENMGLRIG